MRYKFLSVGGNSVNTSYGGIWLFINCLTSFNAIGWEASLRIWISKSRCMCQDLARTTLKYAKTFHPWSLAADRDLLSKVTLYLQVQVAMTKMHPASKEPHPVSVSELPLVLKPKPSSRFQAQVTMPQSNSLARTSLRIRWVRQSHTPLRGRSKLKSLAPATTHLDSTRSGTKSHLSRLALRLAEIWRLRSKRVSRLLPDSTTQFPRTPS